MKLLSILMAQLTFGASAWADTQMTDCVIYVHNSASGATCKGAVAISSDLASHEAPNTWFTDHDQGANMGAARCAERAQEFLNWCGGDYAFSVFRVQGHNNLGAAANSSGSVWISDGVSHWTPFHN
jgi:hypothetical protein